MARSRHAPTVTLEFLVPRLLLGVLLHAPARPADSQAPWKVGLRSTGPIRYGMTVQELERALGRKLMDTTGRQPESCDYILVQSGPNSIGVMVVGVRVMRVDVRSHSIATISGAQVGDPGARIHKLYSRRIEVTPHKYIHGHYLTFVPADEQDQGYPLIFETDGDKVLEYRAGPLPAVEWVERCS